MSQLCLRPGLGDPVNEEGGWPGFCSFQRAKGGGRGGSSSPAQPSACGWGSEWRVELEVQA